MDPFVGEIKMVGFNFAPNGWLLCQGQTLPIAQYQALFALLGTTFGGNGTSTFNLPDLRGRAPINFGQGLGLSPYEMGQQGGQEQVTLTAQNLPPHTHPVAPPISNASATTASPAGAYPAVDVTTVSERGLSATTMSYAPNPVQGQTGGSYQTGSSGSALPVSVEQPYLVVNFIIAFSGVFPSRG